MSESLFTVCARAGHQRERERELDAARPTSLPIIQSSAFEIDDLETLDAISSGAMSGHVYTRVSNPTLRALEADVATLEGGERAIAFASGMAAISTVFTAFLEQGDHVVCAEHIYGVTYAALQQIFARFGVTATFVDILDERAVTNAFTDRTRLVMAETLSNPVLQVADLQMLARVAHARNAKLVVDNTFATPLLCRPLSLGADLVIHSATKYLGGHSDLIAGVVVGSEQAMKAVFPRAILLGATLDPFAGWLLVRGLKTLALRVDRQCENARLLAEKLAAHPSVSRVYYPAGALNGRGGAIVTINVRTNVRDVVRKLAHIPVVTSLGGTVTTVNHPASTSHRSVPAAERARLGIVDEMLRFSIGIEDPADLWAELQQALA